MIIIIDTKCCMHYNGTGNYLTGYCVFPFLRIAVCKDCGSVQDVSKFPNLMKMCFYISSGKINITNEV